MAINEEEKETWGSSFDDVCQGTCDRCGDNTEVRLCEDPLLEEIYPEDSCDTEYWCYPCWSDRKDEI